MSLELTDFFESSLYYTGPSLTPLLVAEAEKRLGFRLPKTYVRLMGVRNGGVPRRRCFAAGSMTSWAQDHVEISAILGLGGDWGIDGERGSRYMIEEWGYPEIGLVVCDMPSGGHDAVMLDYRRSGAFAEPEVVYVEDSSSRILRLAASFDEFILNLQDCSIFRRFESKPEGL